MKFEELKKNMAEFGWTLKKNKRLVRSLNRWNTPKWIVTVIDESDQLPDEKRQETALWMIEEIRKHLASTHEEAKELYLANLQRRADREAFGGLPKWQFFALKDCKEKLPDHLCDVVGVPHGSTLGYSITNGEHYLAIPS